MCMDAGFLLSPNDTIQSEMRLSINGYELQHGSEGIDGFQIQ